MDEGAPRLAGSIRFIVGPLATLAVLGIIEFLLPSIPNPSLVYLIPILFSVFVGGAASGMLSAVLGILYSAYFFSAAHPFHVDPVHLHRLVVSAFTIPVMVFLVAVLKHRAEASARLAAAKEAAEAHVRQLQDEISRRKLAEEALKTEEERFRLVAYSIQDAIYDWDVTNDSIWWNDVAGKFYGYVPEKHAAGISWWKSQIHPDESEHIIKSLYAALGSGKDRWAAEYRFRRADGSYAYLLDRGFFVRDEHGKARRMIGAMTDISERKLAQEERERLLLKEQAARAEAEAARELDRLKSNFVNAVTHELRTPLTAIVGYVELMEEEITGPLTNGQRDFLTQITRAAARLELLANDLLDFARMDAGTFQLRCETADLLRRSGRS